LVSICAGEVTEQHTAARRPPPRTVQTAKNKLSKIPFPHFDIQVTFGAAFEKYTAAGKKLGTAGKRGKKYVG
jgi:hypothetical protein